MGIGHGGTRFIRLYTLQMDDSALQKAEAGPEFNSSGRPEIHWTCLNCWYVWVHVWYDLRYVCGTSSAAFPINAYCRPHRDPTIQKTIYYDSSYDDLLEIIRWIRLIILILIVLDSYYNGLPATEPFSDRSPEGGASSLQILVSNHHMVTIYLTRIGVAATAGNQKMAMFGTGDCVWNGCKCTYSQVISVQRKVIPT